MNKIKYIFVNIIFLIINPILFSQAEYIGIDTGNIEMSFTGQITPISGVCGIATIATKTVPTGNLCNSGNPTIVTSLTGSFTWNCNGISGGSNISCSAPRQYTITFDSNGGTTPNPVSKDIVYNNDIGTLATTSKTGSSLLGWYDALSGGNKFETTTKVLKDTTIYAIWQNSGQSSSNNSSSSSSLGGSNLIKDNCPSGDYSGSYYDKKCGEKEKINENIPKKEEDIKNIENINHPITKNENKLKENKTIPKFITPKKETRQCEENNLVKARQCEFKPSDLEFLDIRDSIFKDYIAKLGKNSIFEGYYDTKLFKPKNTISRAEYLKIILRAFCIDYDDVDTSKIPFKDVDKNSWEAKVIAKALELNAINDKNIKFRPHDPISRVESLKIIFDITGTTPENAYVTKFEDVDAYGWEIKYIEKSYDMCIVDGYKVDGRFTFKPYDNMLREEVAKVIANTLNL
ncbi:S-layer homology domain-containing protein [Candidatus Gracilibacteria bacterium]|nr:S-layer homology domain-containing protein [Candidatus Gracilibacteria bacterium]